MVGFFCATWYVLFVNHEFPDFIFCSLHGFLSFKWCNCIMQIHIGFCILAAIAPPIFFHGRSLTWVSLCSVSLLICEHNCEGAVGQCQSFFCSLSIFFSSPYNYNLFVPHFCVSQPQGHPCSNWCFFWPCVGGGKLYFQELVYIIHDFIKCIV